MNITRNFKNYFFVFFLFGQSSCNAISWRCSRSRATRFIPVIIYVLATATFTAPVFLYFNQLSQLYEKETAAFLCFVQFLAMLVTITSVTNAIVYQSEILTLIYSFDRVIKYLQHSSERCLTRHINKFKRLYNHKCITLFVIWTLYTIIFVATNPLKDRPMKVDAFQCFMYFYKYLAKAHILFYIDLMVWCQEINTQQIIVKDGYSFVAATTGCHWQSQRTINAKEFINKLRHCKYIHFKLWKISNLINSHFGWVMMVVLLVNFTEGLLALFWIFRYLQEPNRFTVLRNCSLFTISDPFGVFVVVIMKVHRVRRSQSTESWVHQNINIHIFPIRRSNSQLRGCNSIHNDPKQRMSLLRGAGISQYHISTNELFAAVFNRIHLFLFD